MRSRLLKAGALAACVSVLSACSMIDHKNTMIFGTNTSLGISAGADATNIPQVNVGYRRQEAVIMPLLANQDAGGGKQRPCAIADSADPNHKAQTDCKFVGEYGENNIRDSYSVLASFGAKFGANGKESTIQGGLAQYFATGVAAQVLALKGGASVIALGEAAQASAKKDISSDLSALVGDPGVKKAAMKETIVQEGNRDKLVAYLKTLKTDDEIDAFLTKLGTESVYKDPALIGTRLCKGDKGAKCVQKIEAGDADAFMPDIYAAFEKQPKP